MRHNERVEGLKQRVLAKLEQLAPEAAMLVVAVSGGPDSVALLRLLYGGPYHLHVAHFDHALRPESGDDAAFVQALAASLELPYHYERADVARIASEKGWNLEDAARRLRYSFLSRVAKRVRADATVTGHSQDDQAETVLMQLLRGAAFLRGMPERQGKVLRPLLTVSRRELLEHLLALKQPYRTDTTNLDPSFTRAWLRQEVLPGLEARYPALKKTLARLAELQGAQEAHFDALTDGFFHDDELDTATLQSESVALQRHAIARLLRRQELAPDFNHLEAIREALGTTRPTRLSLPKGHLAVLAYGKLTVERPQAVGSSLQEVRLETLPDSIDKEKLALFPGLVYRTRQPGDRITLAGGTKKLSDLLIDLKVPRAKRDALKLLASGAQVLWVEGLATDVRVARAAHDPDLPWMRLALEQAEAALAAEEVPIGAAIVKDSMVIAEGRNAAEASHDPTAHAEVLAIRQAARRLGDWRLQGCTLYVTLEPCPMCFGAMLQAQLPRLVYGAPNHRDGALGSVSDLRVHAWKQQLVVRSGLLDKEAGSLLSEFFERQRH